MAHRPAAPTFGQLRSSLTTERLGAGYGPGLAPSRHVPAWVFGLERRHVRVMSVATVFVALGAAVFSLPQPVEVAVLASAVTLLGLPHGALDYLSGRDIFGPRFGRTWFLPFGTIYIGLAALVFASWLIAPTATLIAFLIVSAIHFGLGDIRRGFALGAETSFAGAGVAIEAMARGALVTVVMMLVHPAEISELFAHLVPTAPGQIEVALAFVVPKVALIAGTLLAVVVAHHLGGWAAGSDPQGLISLEIGALLTLFVLAPPLVAFVVYFCFWHSFRHSLHQAAALNPSTPRAAWSAWVKHAWPTTLAAVALLIFAGVWLEPVAVEAAVVRTVFMGLSALTLPHIVFCWLAERGQRERLA